MVANPHPHESLRAERLGAVGERIELRPAHVAFARDADALDRLGARERLEIGGFEHLA